VDKSGGGLSTCQPSVAVDGGWCSPPGVPIEVCGSRGRDSASLRVRVKKVLTLKCFQKPDYAAFFAG